jgi:uncharacterized membrane protein YagU involved in acid resistance
MIKTDNSLRDVVTGGLAGLAATVPMTVVMRGLHALLPAYERYPLPPQQITSKAADAVGLETEAHGLEWELKTHAAHYAYGAGCGAAYALAAPHLPGTPAVKGAVFGIGVWTVSYLGWLPAAGILPPATREPAGRNVVMLLAHVVWGAAAATLLDRRRSR